MAQDNEISKLQSFLQHFPAVAAGSNGEENTAEAVTATAEDRQAVLERIRANPGEDASLFDELTDETHDCEGVLWETVASIVDTEGRRMTCQTCPFWTMKTPPRMTATPTTPSRPL